MQMRVAERGMDCEVVSAGLLEGGRPSPSELIEAISEYDLDLSLHTSRQVTSEDVDLADIALTMERMHVRETALLSPGSWQRTFTLKEFVRRAGETGGLQPGQSLSDWVSSVHGERQ